MAELTENEKRGYIKSLLRDFKDLMGEGRFRILERVKNQVALVDLGLTETQREDLIYDLSVENYCDGPKTDQYRPGVYWEFGQEFDEIDIYIKLAITSERTGEFADCMSFHRAELPMRYPFLED